MAFPEISDASAAVLKNEVNWSPRKMDGECLGSSRRVLNQAASYSRTRRPRWRRPGEMGCVDGNVRLDGRELIIRSAIQPGLRPLEWHLNARHLAIVAVVHARDHSTD